MSQRIVIPTPLRKYTQGVELVEVEAGDLKQALDQLEQRFPGIRTGIFEHTGALRRFINIYVDGEDVRFLSDLETPVKEGTEIAIVPAIAGGCLA
jgi:molybdopterin synthase sulfur carrier subunit